MVWLRLGVGDVVSPSLACKDVVDVGCVCMVYACYQPWGGPSGKCCMSCLEEGIAYGEVTCDAVAHEAAPGALGFWCGCVNLAGTLRLRGPVAVASAGERTMVLALKFPRRTAVVERMGMYLDSES